MKFKITRDELSQLYYDLLVSDPTASVGLANMPVSDYASWEPNQFGPKDYVAVLHYQELRDAAVSRSC
jgi:hypothetical protein